MNYLNLIKNYKLDKGIYSSKAFQVMYNYLYNIYKDSFSFEEIPYPNMEGSICVFAVPGDKPELIYFEVI